ncbi:MAG: CoA-binding protein [Desulfovibrionaceae bacterium]
MLHSTQELTALLAQVKTIAVVGAVDKPGRPVDRIGRYLMGAGFTVIPVHPKRKDVWGLPTYPSLLDIPEPVDLVNLFRRAEFCPDHAREALRMRPLPKAVWMQSGIVSDEARYILKDAPIVVVEDRCVMVDHQRMAGAK